MFRGIGQGRAGRRRVADSAGWTVRQAVRTPHFWLLFAVYMFTGLGSFLVALHQLAFAVDIGFDKLYAAGVLGMGAFLSLPGVIITGTLSPITSGAKSPLSSPTAPRSSAWYSRC